MSFRMDGDVFVYEGATTACGECGHAMGSHVALGCLERGCRICVPHHRRGGVLTLSRHRKGATVHVRTVEAPRAPGRAIHTHRVFDGTPVYVQPEDLRYDVVRREGGR